MNEAPSKRKRRTARQLALHEIAETSPIWAKLPEACRREVVELVGQLLRGDALPEEADNE